MTDLPDTLNPALAARAATMGASVAVEPIEGEWDDQEWRSVAARRVRTPAQNAFVAAGPRAHPFGPGAVRVAEDKQPVRFFPSEAARKAWVDARGTTVPPPPAPAPLPAAPAAPAKVP